MAFVIADRVAETTTSTGTGTINLLGPGTGLQSFVAGVGDGNSTYYLITDNTDWEVGIGTVTAGSPDTLSRDTVLKSTNSDAAVNWGAGTKDVILSIPADKIAGIDSPNQWTEENEFIKVVLTNIVDPLKFEKSGYTLTKVPTTLTGNRIQKMQDKAGTDALTSDVQHGQCQLQYTDASTLTLVPYNGNRLRIDSEIYAVPDAGVELDVTGLSNDTTYYIYAYMNSGTMTLEASATAPETQAGTGVRIKTSDATRTLVGMARVGTAAFAGNGLTRSWFNDQGFTVSAAFTANRSTTSTSLAEINTEIRCNFLNWANEVIDISFQGAHGNNVLNQIVYTNLNVDGTSLDGQTNYSASGNGAARSGASLAKAVNNLAEATLHYATIFGKVGANTGTWYGGSSPERSVLNVSSRGRR